ncbi:hypothetical protein QA601_17775 [Chitinispirillales bacterium ANBcel5]|uniref:hypothetical protein n=1 Tax=Cellulosispirillum alkaliphilum TaxID=3039283 RepID=UPI002A582B55|nr:hypothetical protein [Chitinispirillales bacterium ANBcel5]
MKLFSVLLVNDNLTKELGLKQAGVQSKAVNLKEIKKFHVFAIMFIVALLITALPARADDDNVVHANSGSRNDIQAAIDAAPENGTVVIPEGEFNIQGPRISVNKNLTITGSGDKETILNGRSGLDWIFHVVTEGFFRLTNVVLDGNNARGGVMMRSDDLTMRVDNSTLTNFTYRGVESYGGVRGVIDNNEFLENHTTDVVVYGDNDASWDRPLALGSDDAVYVEDNLFRHHRAPNSHSIASNRGARYVFRHNRIENGSQNTNPIDAHGNFYHGRGSRSYEIYGNEIDVGHSYMGMFLRGGTGVVFDNEFTGSFTHPLVLENYRSFRRGANGRFASYPAPDQIQDLHIWNNTINGDDVTPYIHDRGVTRQHIQENRDFFMEELEDYEPYTYPHPLTAEDFVASRRASSVAVTEPSSSSGSESTSSSSTVEAVTSVSSEPATSVTTEPANSSTPEPATSSTSEAVTSVTSQPVSTPSSNINSRSSVTTRNSTVGRSMPIESVSTRAENRTGNSVEDDVKAGMIDHENPWDKFVKVFGIFGR